MACNGQGMIAVVVAIHVGNLQICLVDRGFEGHSASVAGSLTGAKIVDMARWFARETDIVR
jgi:hypothetical protein